eukprot:11272602-Heterocapsa_arctica.AAC.1
MERRDGSTAARQQLDPAAQQIATHRPPAGPLLSPMLEPSAGRAGTIQDGRTTQDAVNVTVGLVWERFVETARAIRQQLNTNITCKRNTEHGVEN